MKNILKKLSWKAIIAGTVFTFISIFALIIFLFILHSVFQLDNPNFINDPMMYQHFVDQNLFQLLVLSTFFSILAGFITAVIARKNEFLNTLAVYLLVLVLAFIMLPPWENSDISYPDWFMPIDYIATPLAYLLGGYFGASFNRDVKSHR